MPMGATNSFEDYHGNNIFWELTCKKAEVHWN